MRSAAAVLVVVALTEASVAHAHPLGLGALRIEAEDDGTLDVLLRVSPDEAGAADPTLDTSGCEVSRTSDRTDPDGTITMRRRLRCEPGASLVVGGLAGSSVRVVTTVRRGGHESRLVLDADSPPLSLDATDPDATPLGESVTLGAEHVALGVDHLLFVLGLLLLARSPRALVVSITGFTVGHSLTLGLAALELVRVPRAPVEILIAVSLVFVALEIVRPESAPETLSARRPWALASLFGLVHGLGFAGALLDVGADGTGGLAALLGFNLGVELGQLAFVALAVLVGLALSRFVAQRTLRSLGAYAIGAAGVAFVIDRTLARVVELL